MNNQNSGVLVAANTALDNISQRAIITAAGIDQGTNLLRVFTSDGYNPEGVGYFVFGFQDLVIIREAIYQATNKAQDLFSQKRVGLAALFGVEFPMNWAVSASFADSPYSHVLHGKVIGYISAVFGVPSVKSDELGSDDHKMTLPLTLISLMTSINPPKKLTGLKSNGIYELRKFYPETGVLVSRPTKSGSADGISATFKLLGQNAGHAHNDFGSYQISVNGIKLTGDPGGPAFYDARTFNPKFRFSSFIINSYGHPVPVVGGQLQLTGWNLLGSGSKRIPQLLSYSFRWV
jgi:hypothetical protein